MPWLLPTCPARNSCRRRTCSESQRLEKPIAAVLDALEAQFGVGCRRTALLGMSLGGYFVSKAAAAPDSLDLGAIVATPVLTRPEALFSLSVTQAEAEEKTGKQEDEDETAGHKEG